MKFPKIVPLLMTALLSSCAMNVDVMTPDAEIAGLERTEADLGVWIDPAIRNEFEVSSGGLKTAHFKNYRTSLENAFGATFSKYFKGVYFTGRVPPKGLLVRLYKAAPKHIVMGSSGQIHWTGGYSSSVQMVGMQVSWYAEIYQDGVKVRTSEGKVLSDERTDNVYDAEAVTSDALRLMMEQFGSEIRAIADGVDPSTPANVRTVVIPVKKASSTSTAAAPKPASAAPAKNASGSAGL